MKWFISQPMKGLSDYEIQQKRIKIEEYIKKYDPNAEILDSFFMDDFDSKNIGVKYLAKSLDLLAEADRAYFASGWKGARGCKIEHDVAVAYRIPYVVEVRTDDGIRHILNTDYCPL